MKVIKVLGGAVQYSLLILLALILLCNLYVLAGKALFHEENPTVMGWSWAVVLTGSMEPEISGNDVIVTKAQSEYDVDDIVMFESGSVLVTHRIVDETAEGFITRGDANNTPDRDPVLPEQIVGKVVFIIPAAGLVMGYLKTPMGMMCTVAIVFLLIEIPYLLEKRKREEGCEVNDLPEKQKDE